MARTLKIAPTEPPSGAPERAEALAADAVHAVPAPNAMAAAVAASRLGSILVQSGRLEPRHVEAVLSQQLHNPKRFGELAVALGLVARADIELALAQQFDVDFLPADGLAELGVAPLQTQHDEVMRGVRSQLLLRWFGAEPEQRTLAVLSHGAGEGRSHVCAQLGRLLAQTDEDTLLIDADLHRPSLHEHFGIDNRTGLSTYLMHETLRAPVRAVRGTPRLHLLPAGPVRPQGPALLERRDFAVLLGNLARRYAHILIDTPPAGAHPEALTVAVRASGALMVTRRNRTRVADAQRVAQLLGRHGVEVLGAIINER